MFLRIEMNLIANRSIRDRNFKSSWTNQTTNSTDSFWKINLYAGVRLQLAISKDDLQPPDVKKTKWKGQNDGNI